jgi:hypothetical protein
MTGATRPLSQWLFNALAEASLPVVCVETRHMRAVLKAQINKTERSVPSSEDAKRLVAGGSHSANCLGQQAGALCTSDWSKSSLPRPDSPSNESARTPTGITGCRPPRRSTTASRTRSSAQSKISNSSTAKSARSAAPMRWIEYPQVMTGFGIKLPA